MAAGDIVVNVTADKRKFASGLTSAMTDTKRFGDTLTKELTLVQRGINKVSAEYALQGRESGTRLSILVKQESELTAAIAKRSMIVENARLALKREGDQAIATARQVAAADTIIIQTRARAIGGARGTLNAGGLQMFGQSAAYGLQDALSAGQYGGLRGAAGAMANNLPMLGMAASQVASGFTKSAGAVGMFARTIAPLAGPAGLVASIALPLGAMLIPKLLETKKAADDSEKSLEDWGQTFRNIHRDVEAQAFFGVERQFRRGDLGQKDSDSLVAESRAAARERLRIDSQIEAVQKQRAAVLERVGVPADLTARLGMPSQTNPDPATSLLLHLGKTNPGFGKELGAAEYGELSQLNEKLKDLGAEAFEVGTRITDSLKAMKSARMLEREDAAKGIEKWHKDRDVAMDKLEKDHKERLGSLRSEMLGTASPNQAALESITGTLEKRRKEITALTFGDEREGLLGLANQAAIEQARSLKTKLPRGPDALASVTTRGNAADFMNQMRATLQGDGKSEEARLAEQQLKEAVEQNKKLQKLIDALREQPESVATSMEF